MGKVRLKTIVQVLFFAAVTVAVLVQLATVYSRWRSGRQVRAEIWANARVSVLRTAPHFPPGILVEYANGSRFPIDKSRFVLSLFRGAEEVASTEREFREVKAGKTVHVLLQTVAAATAAPPPPPGTKLTYRLIVLAGQRKPLPETTGEIEIR